MRIITFKELSSHNEINDCWILVNGLVYDVTSFKNKHPGGEMILFDYAGKDASSKFSSVGHSEEANEMAKEFLVGKIQSGPIPPQNKVIEKPMNKRQIFLIVFALALYFTMTYLARLDFFTKYKLK